MKVMLMGRGYGGRWSVWFFILITSIFLLLAMCITTFWVWVIRNLWLWISVVPVHASGRQGEIKIVCLHLNKYLLIFSTKIIFFKTLEYQIGCNNFTQKVSKVGLYLSLLHFLTFSSKLDRGSHIIFIAKNCLQENWMKFLFPEVLLYLYKSSIRPCLEYCCHIWAGAPSCYSELLDKLQKWICRTVGLLLTASLEPIVEM